MINLDIRTDPTENLSYQKSWIGKITLTAEFKDNSSEQLTSLQTINSKEIELIGPDLESKEETDGFFFLSQDGESLFLCSSDMKDGLWFGNTNA